MPFDEVYDVLQIAITAHEAPVTRFAKKRIFYKLIFSTCMFENSFVKKVYFGKKSIFLFCLKCIFHNWIFQNII